MKERKRGAPRERERERESWTMKKREEEIEELSRITKEGKET
ncbi:unnamed protein product [Camellia sinensis]